MERILADTDLMDSWLLALRGEGKAANTRRLYGTGVRQFIDWAEKDGREPVLDRRTVWAFLDALHRKDAEPGTVRARQVALRRFTAWLAEEGECEEDPLLGLKPVKTPVKVTPELSDRECAALIKACRGKDFRDVRDVAIVYFMIETGARAGETAGLLTADVNLAEGSAIIRKTKTGHPRTVWFSAKTATAIDRYKRARRRHAWSDSPALWLGERGHGFSYEGLYSTLCRRAKAAGVEPFHPHVLRHTAASRWLARGGSEQGLMAMAGWRSRAMLDRYTANSAQRRAGEESRRLHLGDDL